MRGGVRQALMWALVLALAGPGCARFRNPPPPRPPMPPMAGEPAAPEGTGNCAGRGAEMTVSSDEIRLKLNPDRILALSPRPGQESEGETGEQAAKEPPQLRLLVDPSMVRALQMQEIEALRSEEEADIHPRNGFTRWLDGFHERLYCRMDNAVRRVDTMWLTEEIRPYDYQLSTFKIKLLVRVGGRSNDDSSDYKIKFRADFALPSMKRRLHLFVDNLGRDSLPGQDPMKQEDDTRVGARVVRPLRYSELDFGGGARLHSGMPVGFGEVNWRWKWSNDLGRVTRLTPRGYWYSDEGWGQSTTLSWTRPVDTRKRKIIQFRTVELSSEESNGWEFEQTVRFAWLRANLHRGLLAQASVFPHYGNSDFHWDDSLVNVMWRGSLYRKWIYYTLTPQVEFPKEDGYKAMPSFRIGLEILMGGEISDLI